MVDTPQKQYILDWEYVDKDLEASIIHYRNKNQKFQEFQILQMITEILQAYQALYEAQIPHGRIHPRHILLQDTPEVQFQLINQELTLEQEQLAFYPQDVQFNPQYLFFSPELLNIMKQGIIIDFAQFMTQQQDWERSEIFSLGMTALSLALKEPLLEVYNYQDLTIQQSILQQKLKLFSQQYSVDFFNLLTQMLSLESNLRPSLSSILDTIQKINPADKLHLSQAQSKIHTSNISHSQQQQQQQQQQQAPLNSQPSQNQIQSQVQVQNPQTNQSQDYQVNYKFVESYHDSPQKLSKRSANTGIHLASDLKPQSSNNPSTANLHQKTQKLPPSQQQQPEQEQEQSVQQQSSQQQPKINLMNENSLSQSQYQAIAQSYQFHTSKPVQTPVYSKPRQYQQQLQQIQQPLPSQSGSYNHLSGNKNINSDRFERNQHKQSEENNISQYEPEEQFEIQQDDIPQQPQQPQQQEEEEPQEKQIGELSDTDLENMSQEKIYTTLKKIEVMVKKALKMTDQQMRKSGNSTHFNTLQTDTHKYGSKYHIKGDSRDNSKKPMNGHTQSLQQDPSQVMKKKQALKRAQPKQQSQPGFSQQSSQQQSKKNKNADFIKKYEEQQEQLRKLREKKAMEQKLQRQKILEEQQKKDQQGKFVYVPNENSTSLLSMRYKNSGRLTRLQSLKK